MARSSSNLQKRKHIRFKPDSLDVAYLDTKEKGAFEPKLVALILEEAPMGGAGLVLRETDILQVGDVCVIKVGKMAPLRAEVCWRKKLDNMVIRMGVKFLE